jgi:hypothetical protein
VAQVAKDAAELLTRSMPAERAAELAAALTSGKWTHDHPITAVEAAAMGLVVSQEMPEEVLELMALYPQASRVSAVEYYPVPPARQPAAR